MLDATAGPPPTHTHICPCRFLLHASFLSPVLVLVLWVKPIARDFLAKAPMGKTSVTL